ncbi:MAG: PUR family DNA/RNA-binding protein [Phocaeicola plebeius]|nr:PUR family DNA/RNA-binding protein [Phocaeicola plebeius]
MEDSTKKSITEGDKDIVFSKAIRAGKRIYYLDVKRSRGGDMFIAITESKKVVRGEDDSQVSFEKHKIFLYKEDFKKFSSGLKQTIAFIEEAMAQQADENSPDTECPTPEDSHTPVPEPAISSGEIKIDIDF